jgi:amino acid permease
VIEAIAGRAWAMHRIPVLTTGIATVFMSIGISMMDESWSLMLYAIGGFAFNMLAFIVPAVYYLAQFRFKSVKWGAVAVLVLVFGFFVLASSFHGFLADMIELAEGGQ